MNLFATLEKEQNTPTSRDLAVAVEDARTLPAPFDTKWRRWKNVRKRRQKKRKEKERAMLTSSSRLLLSSLPPIMYLEDRFSFGTLSTDALGLFGLELLERRIAL